LFPIYELETRNNPKDEWFSIAERPILWVSGSA